MYILIRNNASRFVICHINKKIYLRDVIIDDLLQ